MPQFRFEYEPLPIFVPFHVSHARLRSLFGGYGSGKSVAGCAEIIAWGLECPGSEFFVTRKTVPALKDTTEKTFVNLLPAEFLKQCRVKRGGNHLDQIEFPNGSLYYFRSMDDWKKHRSHNLAGILWDEADEFTREDFEGMDSRLRQTEPTAAARANGVKRITRHGHIFASNPQGHNWLWEIFVGPKRLDETEYWTSSSLDNPFLPLSYIKALLAMPDPWVRRYVLCNFDEFAGAIYPDWTYETHVLDVTSADYLAKAKDRGGFIVMGFDPGTSSGNAALWAHYDPEQHRYVGVAEYNEKGLAASIHARAWRKIESGLILPVRDRIADPKPIATRDRGSNMQLSMQYRRLGYPFRPGTDDIDTKVTALGQLIFQGRFVLTKDCPMSFDQIRNYRWEDLTPSMIEKGRPAKPLKKDVDLVDATQFIATRYVKAPSMQVNPADLTPEQMVADQTWKSIRKQLRRKTATSGHDLGSISL